MNNKLAKQLRKIAKEKGLDYKILKKSYKLVRQMGVVRG